MPARSAGYGLLCIATARPWQSSALFVVCPVATNTPVDEFDNTSHQMYFNFQAFVDARNVKYKGYAHAGQPTFFLSRNTFQDAYQGYCCTLGEKDASGTFHDQIFVLTYYRDMEALGLPFTVRGLRWLAAGDAATGLGVFVYVAHVCLFNLH